MKRVMINEIDNLIGGKIQIKGWVYRLRKLKTITFIIMRDRTGFVQCVAENNIIDTSAIKLEAVIAVFGEVKESKNVLNPYEIAIEQIEIINNVKEELPIEINKDELEQLKKNAKVHKLIVEEIKKIVKPGISSYQVDTLC